MANWSVAETDCSGAMISFSAKPQVQGMKMEGRRSVQREDDSGADSSQPESEPVEYRAYSRRWLILLAVSLLNFSNAMNWVTFAPIANRTANIFNTSLDNVNMLSIIYMIVSIPVGFLVCWLVDAMGLVIALWAGAALNGIGSVLRVIAIVHLSNGSGQFWLLMFGQALCAIAQPFGLFPPTLVAAVWFPSNQRALANMLASMANPVGIAVGMLVPPFIVTSSSVPEMTRLLWITAIPAGLNVLSTLSVTRKAPPTPPSASAEDHSMPFFQGLKKLFRNRQYRFLLLAWGVGLGSFNVLITLLQQYLCPWGYPDRDAGIAGGAMCLAGLIGSGITSWYVDKTKQFVVALKVCFMGASLGLSWFVMVSNLRGQAILIYASLAMFGFFGYGLLPVCLELGVECTYPVAEASSAGILWLAGQVSGIVLVLVSQLDVLQTKLPPELARFATCDDTQAPGSQVVSDMTNSAMLIASLAAVTVAFFCLLFRAQYRRVAAESGLGPDVPLRMHY